MFTSCINRFLQKTQAQSEKITQCEWAFRQLIPNKDISDRHIKSDGVTAILRIRLMILSLKVMLSEIKLKNTN